jgi:hypothetical protein
MDEVLFAAGGALMKACFLNLIFSRSLFSRSLFSRNSMNQVLIAPLSSLKMSLCLMASLGLCSSAFASQDLGLKISPALSSTSQTSLQEVAQFAISPYLFKNGSVGTLVGWLYSGEVGLPATQQVDLYDGTKLVSSDDGYFDGIVWTAHLALPDCGYGEQMSYQVSGMKSKVLIAPIACPGTGSSARFSFIADAQQEPKFVRELANELQKFPGSAILSGGDLVQTGSDLLAWQSYFDALQPYSAARVSLSAIGNHEYRSNAQTNYFQNFFQVAAHDAHYSVTIGDAHIIVLNSNFSDDPTLVDSQLPWLEKELAKPAKWKFVMFHHPPYSVGFFNSVVAPLHEFMTLREKYVPLFEAYKVDVVLNGHNHIFERSQKSGIQYFVAGPAGGAMGYVAAPNEYSLKTSNQRTITHFEVTEHNMRAVTFSIDGHILDDLNLAKK